MTHINIKINFKVFIISWICILCAYIPVWLAFYPGIASYDVNIQVKYVMENHFSTHHPILHSILLGGLYKVGCVLEKPGMGIDYYTLIQMIILSAVFAYAVAYLYASGLSKKLCICYAVFYGVFPINSILAVSATKDALFAVLVLLYVMNMLQLQEGELSKKAIAGNIIITVLMLLMRNNALYAWMVSMPVMLLIIKKNRKKFAVLQFCILILFFVFSQGLIALTGAEKSSPVEMLSVPAQQMARVGYYHEEVKESSSLSRFIPEETIEQYNPYLADNIKFYMNSQNVRNNKKGFINEWITLGIEHPKEYIEAFLYNNIGFWYINDLSHTDIYGDKEGFGYLTDARLSYDGNPIGKEHSYFPLLKQIYHNCFVENQYLNIPIIRLFFSPAFWWWLLVFIAVIIYYKGDRNYMLPIVFLIVYYVTLLFGPTCLIRYMYPIIVCIPVLLGMIRKERKEE
ncbi:DUF6020 family protein [Kineothrix alysoides]|uniref:DUF6020 family protein n=1 Tax=Kineothrix alysoides TaxID=1469948 RepID=UPI001052F09E|nr:DUF6020 family protein [Kineothrix alysoides]